MKIIKKINPIIICFIFMIIAFCVIIFAIPAVDSLLFEGNKQEIAVLYTDMNFDYVNGDYTIISSYEQFNQIMNGYIKDKKKIGNHYEDIDILKEKIKSEYFETKNLVMIKGFFDSYVSKIKTHGKEAEITFRGNGQFGNTTITMKTYFVPINNKNVETINIKFSSPPDTERNFYLSIIILPSMLLLTSIVEIIKLVKGKAKIVKENNEVIDEFEKDTYSNKKSNIGKIILIVLGIMLSLFLLLVGFEIYNNAKNTVAKPIIYLYPEKEEKVSVKLGHKDKITVSYPKYINGWNVLAKPNGDLVDLDNKRNLYSLYYESDAAYKFKVQKDGFVVKKDNITEFLEEKLKILGLNDREAEEFIIYWLPILEKNEYTYIRFATKDEIEKNMPLEISPKPDNLIRVLMTYKKLEKPIKAEEQKLTTPERTGFVAVEWGGTEID